ncbi:unnamed protein product, partial [marine sediment metagenome]
WREKYIGQEEKNIGQNIGSHPISHPISHNSGGSIVVFFVLALLIIFLLDHFAFNGKLLAYIRSYFYEEEKEIPLAKVPETQGFEGRSEEDL